jgi:hypothetical protein
VTGSYQSTIDGNQRWVYVFDGGNKSWIVAKSGISETWFSGELMAEKSARFTTIAPTGNEIQIDVGTGH